MTSALALRRRAMGKGGPLVSDSFNRADSTTSLGSVDTGQVWSTSVANRWGIVANRAYLASTEGNGGYLASVAAGQSAQDVSVDLQLSAGAAGGLLFRVVDFDNFLLFNLNKVANHWALYRVEAGAFVVLATDGFTVSGAAIYALRCTVNAANLITCYIDGSPKVQVTDGTHSSGTSAGMRVYHEPAAGYDGTVPRFDNFKVTAA